MSTVRYTDITPQDMRKDVEREVLRHKGWYFFEGLLFLVAGILAIALPGVTTLAASAVISAVLCVGGVMRLVNAFRFETGRTWRVVSGAGFLFVGGALLLWPLAGVASLIVIAGALLLAEGVVEVFLSLAYRPLFRWGLLLVSGATSFILGALIFAFPVAGVIFIAVSIGLSMVVYGASLLALLWSAG